MVDANGQPLGTRDADRPILHVLPKLLVPANVLATNAYDRDGLSCYKIELVVTSTLPVDINPEGGVKVRQPYANRRYFVGGSSLIRNGWVVPLPVDVTEFDIEFSWRIQGDWQTFRCDEWEVRHLLHVKLLPGKGVTYTMDGACWPKTKASPMQGSPVTPLGIEDETPVHKSRSIVRTSDLVWEAENELVGYYVEENLSITGIPLDQAWTIDAHQDEQIHEIKQTALLKLENDAHRANAPVEMPSALLVKAIDLAREIPFEEADPFARSVDGIPGGCERHPAMQLLCEWWETARPATEPFKPGSAVVLVRVRDDGEYWFAYHETPNAPVLNFNPSGQDMARVGDNIAVLFQAVQEAATFNGDGMTVMLPSGEPWQTIGISKDDFLSGGSDEAWFCLKGLSAFPTRFPATWDFLNQKGYEYREFRRAQVAITHPLPEGTEPCMHCNGLPVLTEDPTDTSTSRFRLECHAHDDFRSMEQGEELAVAIHCWNETKAMFEELEAVHQSDGKATCKQ